MRRDTRRGIRAGRKLIRHIKCVRLATASYKVSTYYYKPGVNIMNLISLTGNEPAKSLFDVNSFVNKSSSDLMSLIIFLVKVTDVKGVLAYSINRD